MAFRLLFVALIAFMLGLTILQQSIWGNMGPRKAAVITFIGLVFLSAAVVLGALGYLILNLRDTDPSSPVVVLSLILLSLSILGAAGVYARRRSYEWTRQTTASGLVAWTRSHKDLRD